MDHIAQMILMKSERINVDFPITDSARMWFLYSEKTQFWNDSLNNLYIERKLTLRIDINYERQY